MEVLLRKLLTLQQKAYAFELDSYLPSSRKKMNRLFTRLKAMGRNSTLDSFEKRKLGIFNILNFFQLITGLLVPFIGFLTTRKLPAGVWAIACLPALVSALALYLNYRRKYEQSLIIYFILYPFLTCVVYINGINMGTDLNFVLFGILSVFFLQSLGYMIFSIAFSMLSYFLLAIVLKDFRHDLSIINQPFYLATELLIIGYIFFGLWLIKKENTDYQFHILAKNRSLHKKNLEINEQKKVIATKADKLRTQTLKLSQLNSVKNKLFSIISHDLKTPMYALRNLFKNIHDQRIPAKEIRAMMPDVLNEFNYSISLMENLLHWAKTQMQADTIRIEDLDMSAAIESVTILLRPQAQMKRIKMEIDTEPGILLTGDRERVNLVLRNLLSNAIKFTPDGGTVKLGIREQDVYAEVYVQDSGAGISQENISKIQEHNFFSTNGTAGEPGTGLGLMLCQEFLKGLGSELQISSVEGQGSHFSFKLPRANERDVRQTA